jgi:hypothetical protein
VRMNMNAMLKRHREVRTGSMKPFQLFTSCILGVLCLFSMGVRADGVTVNATVDRNQVGMGDVINLTVAVGAQDSIQVDEPHLPPLSGFEVINVSSGVETRSSFVNGKFLTTQSRNFNYMLAVMQKGALIIPEIPVLVEGKTYKTKEIKIMATAARANPQQQQQGRPRGQGQAPFEDMDQMEELFNQMLQRQFQPRGGVPGQNGQAQQPVNPDEAFFVLAEADKKKAFVGEQITANFYLYTRGQIRDIDTLKYPDLKGFWKEELEMATRLNFEQAVINGVAYQRALLVSYALFPIHAGISTIDPYKAKCTVITPSSFGFGHPYQFTKASHAIPIEVSEVPTNGRPANYSGAVGNFRVSAQFEPPTGAVNQPVTLRVRFEGQGNAKLIELPKLELPPSFEFYDQKSQAKFLKDGTSFKEFEVLIIPREPGVFNVAPVATAVFDPGTMKFTTIASQPLNITVTGSATSPAAPVLPGTATAEQRGDGAGAGPYLPSLSSDIERTGLSNPLAFVTPIGLYLMAFAVMAWQAWTQLRRKPKRASLKAVLKRRAKAMRDLAVVGEWRRVGVELTNATYYLLGQISEQGGAHQELALMLEHTPPSLRNELAGALQMLLEQCEALSFAPEKMLGGRTDKDKLELLIQEFEKVMTRAIVLAEIQDV